MDMEGTGTEELVGGGDATHIAKGKRTKRLRLLSSNCGGSGGGFATAMTCSSSSANSGDHATADYGSFSSTTTTYESSDQEEEDMANCLILLATQGRADSDQYHHHQKNKAEGHDHGVANINKTEKVSNSGRKFAQMATAATTKVGFYIYECKTCNRTFPSFQALGGHRASHKKLKITADEKKPPPSPPQPQPQVITDHDQFEESGQPQIKIGPPISLQLGSPQNHRANNKANKVHECSICGSEFTSGQALGGHMRRHRASSANSTNTQVVGMINGIDQSSCNTTPAAAPMAMPEVQPRNILQLDLNLPAPEDDLRPDSKFQFTATKKSPVVLSAAPALVDCHYQARVGIGGRGIII